ncbi:hypothetical protein [Chitinophaga vietnamensis]|uniref:hypothetical protein n=1 Tax=Chitinophaga vietnamensis TaxID=2593957 RepID=UPI0011785736|nr:hypothetical protein [Chitinophaga vietnamensis]
MTYRFSDFTGNYYHVFAYETSVGKVRLHAFFELINHTATLPTLSTYNIYSYKFKIVVVAGAIAARMRDTHVNFNNIDEVNRATGLWMQGR